MFSGFNADSIRTMGRSINHGRQLIRLLVLRGSMVGLIVLLVSYLLLFSDATIRQLPLMLLVLTAILISFPPVYRLHTGCIVGEREVLLHILLDIILLGAMLFLLGGYTNPLIFLYLLPVLVAALSLPRWMAWMVGALAIFSYTLLLRYYLPMFPTMSVTMHDGVFHLHLLGMWLTFVISVLLLVGVVARISEQRREHERQLAHWVQRSIRERSVIALGAQAASDTHEMSTPVNSLMLLTDHLLTHITTKEGWDIMQQVQQQLHRCQQILGHLRERASTLCRNEPESRPVSHLINDTAAQWRNLNPQAHLIINIPKENDATIACDPMLEQSLFVLFDNALDANASMIHVDVHTCSGQLEIAVLDNGKGFDKQVLAQQAESPVSTKAEGNGLGLYLVRFILEQKGGGITLANRKNGGAVARVHIPIEAMKTGKDI